MQTVKTTLLILVYTAVLSACGLKGPLYLPEQDPDSKPAVEQDLPADVKDTQDKEKGV